jgi:hypothetical protein
MLSNGDRRITMTRLAPRFFTSPSVSAALRIWLGTLCLLVTAVTRAGPAEDANSKFDPIQLQLEFGRASDLTLINRVADIPPDGRDKLAHFGSFDVASPTIPLADIGMDWSSSDARIENLSWGQHRFTAISSSVLAIIFVTGGGAEVQYRVILAPRNSRTYCLFKIQNLGEWHLSISTVQNLLRPDRDQTTSRTPQCRTATIGQPIG